MSAMQIHGSQYPLNKIFSDDFAFEIPNYQRPYAWTTEEAGELLDDLLAALGDNWDLAQLQELPPYFLGSVVLIKAPGQPEAEVVDGQQRLTTLTILFAVLRATIEDSAFADSLSAFLSAKGNKALGTPDRHRLRVRKRDREQFESYVQAADGINRLRDTDPAHFDSVSMKNVSANALQLASSIESLPESQKQALASFLLAQCVVVVVSSPDLDSAYRIFSVMNDRGLDLSHTDILKAEIIGALDKGSEWEYATKWEEAEDELGIEGFQSLFAHIRMIYRKQKMRETLLKEFREHVVPEHSRSELVDDVIVPLSDAYAEVVRHDYKSSRRSGEVNELLAWLTELDNFDWIPPTIEQLRKRREDVDELVRFLTDLERLAASMFIRRVDVTRRVERYGRLLAAMEKGGDLYDAESPLQLSEEECRETVDRLDGPIYLDRNVPRYVLLRLDSLLVGEGASYEHRIISIEHVLPQHPLEGSHWFDDFPDEEEREQLTHRLGNLVLLSRRKNSRARNYDFEKKKNTYFTGPDGSSPFAITTQVLREERWTPDVLRRRQTEAMERLCELWRLGTDDRT